MNKFLILMSLFITNVQAGLTVTDINKFATVSLHTEEMPATKRVYLAADFEATLPSGLVFCELEVNHKRGKDSGKTKTIKKETTLMAGEKMPFNLGVFPNFFHASGLDVKAKLVCKKIDFFEQNKLKVTNAKLLKGPELICCQLNEFRTVCSSGGPSPGRIDVDFDIEEINQPAPSPTPTPTSTKPILKIPSCYPNQ